MNRQIFQGDVVEQLAKFPDSSIDVIISSPPYWGLRDYSVEGQLGLEPDFHDYLNKMQTIMDELKRILKNTGTCWINLGDTYSTETQTAKSRIGIPERFYINCINGGWIARNHIVWTKNNSMPSSVKDRFKNSWESVFFFSKNKKYYFDLDAIRVPSKTDTKPFNARVRDSKKQRYLQKATDEEIKNHNGKGEKYNALGRCNVSRLHRDRKRQDQTITRTHNGVYDENGKLLNNPKGKNPGDVFQINTKPFKEAHFATFPPALPQKILKCACPNQVCNKCGKPRMAIKERQTPPDNVFTNTIKNEDWKGHGQPKTHNGKVIGHGQKYQNWLNEHPDILRGYTDCGCNAGFKRGIVLDPFFGSGTVGLVAEQMGLQWCGIELNPEYIEIAKKRLDPYTSIQKMEAFV